MEKIVIVTDLEVSGGGRNVSTMGMCNHIYAPYLFVLQHSKCMIGIPLSNWNFHEISLRSAVKPQSFRERRAVYHEYHIILTTHYSSCEIDNILLLEKRKLGWDLLDQAFNNRKSNNVSSDNMIPDTRRRFKPGRTSIENLIEINDKMIKMIFSQIFRYY